MKNRMFITVALALLVGSVTIVTATGTAGSDVGKPGACQSFELQNTSTSRNSDGLCYGGRADHGSAVVARSN
jgi:hypothetical protein